MAYLKRGFAGEPVKLLQEKLGVSADGDFGPATEKALIDFQKSHGLAADGVAGPDTFAAMHLYELVLLRVGTAGETVKKLQTALGVTADGKFGSGTAAAVRAFQEKNGLEADGMAGPATLEKLHLFAELTPAAVQRSEIPANEPTPPAAPASASAPTTAAPTPSAAPAPTATAESSGTSVVGPAPRRSIWQRLRHPFG